MCADHGIHMPAQVVDHIIPHKGDYRLFWFGGLQSLCAHHHNVDKKQIETHGYIKEIGSDGYPVDLKHPINQNKS
jgi:hypothetical protein